MKRVIVFLGLLIFTVVIAFSLRSNYNHTGGPRTIATASSHSPAAAQTRSVATGNASAPAAARELDVRVNPYAAALRAPGKSKRSWDVSFLANLKNAHNGDPIQFELTDGRVASGTIRITQFTDGELTYVSGELTQPETGKFFF